MEIPLLSPPETLAKNKTSATPRAGGGTASSPVRFILGVYALAVGAGALLLALPASSALGTWTAPIDAVFTSMSAVCVTGLVVVDTASHWSAFGKTVILLLIQIGGFGIMALGALVGLLVGRRLLLRDTEMLRSALGSLDVPSLMGILKVIALMTLGVEAVGAAALAGWFLHLGYEPVAALASGAFHSVSAFCNAGFSLYPDSMMRYRHDPLVNVVLMSVAFLGGIGFGVFADIGHWLKNRFRRGALLPHVLSLHTKFVLVVSLALVVFGAGLFLAFEAGHTMQDLDAGEKVKAALFTSIVSRTAGFHVVPTEDLAPATLAALMVLMFIGGSPLSTAGGIKTTTFAVMFLALRSIVRQESHVTAFRRRVPPGTVRRSIAIVFAFAGVFVVGLVLLLAIEGKPFLPVAFEAMSAIGTVGLSMGITPDLTPAGKTVIILLMFLGRVGPLTVVLAASGGRTRDNVEYPTDPVMVG